jgi:Flp pilus assembly protein TadD
MSLLMKALEKAAQDRSITTGKPSAPPEAMAGGKTLSLEPLLPTTSSASSAPPEPGTRTTSTHSSNGALRVDATAASRSAALPGAVGHSMRGTSRSNDQTRAAVLLGVQQPARAGSGAAEWISTHPVPFTAALAGALALGYAIYLYLQIAHPHLFLRAPPTQPQPVAVMTPTPVAPTLSQLSQDAGPADTALVPAQSVFSSKPGTSGPPPAPGVTQSGTVESKPVPAIAAPARLSAATATLVATIAPVPQSKIVVSRGDNTLPRVNPAVNDAYAALESGRFEAARPLYEQALRTEPNNIDALLGLAAIAQHENRTDDASKMYLRILNIDPRHALAQTGLIALLGRADPQAAETRLKQLAARDPSPSLYFTLGNLYADQGQWSQAQQAYFQSHHLEAGNPDYAYNLAVALEHLGQQKLALGFYRRALQLAAGRGRANFNSSQAQARITQLAARLE